MESSRSSAEVAELGCPAASHLVAVVVHGHQAVQVEDVAALDQFPHEVRLDGWLGPLVARGGREPLHADGAVLCQREGQGSGGWVLLGCPALTQGPAPSPGPGCHPLFGDRAEPHRAVGYPCTWHCVCPAHPRAKLPRTPWRSHAARTSSGGCRTFCRYFFSTSSGVLPVGERVKG